MAAVLARMQHVRRAVVVTGSDGLDEVTLDGPTRVLVVEEGVIRGETWQPEDFGLSRQGSADLRVDGPEESAQRIRLTLAGEPGPVRDYLLANTAAALWVVDRCHLREAVARGATAIDSGAAARLLDRWAAHGESSLNFGRASLRRASMRTRLGRILALPGIEHHQRRRG